METATAYNKATRTAVYELWTYDVWGNARDGWDVNDRSCRSRDVRIVCRRETCNPGTEHEFHIYAPTDRQLAIASGFTRCKWDGELEGTMVATGGRSARPIGELVFVRWADQSA